MDLPFADTLLRFAAQRSVKQRPIQPIAALQTTRIQRVLVVLTTGLGDAVLSTPVLPTLRAKWPNATIKLWTRAAWAPLFENDVNLDGVIAYAGKYRRFWSMLTSLKTFAPDLVVVLHGNDPDILPLCVLSGARLIVRVPVQGTRFQAFLSNRAREADQQILPNVHYIENRLRVLDALGLVKDTRVPRIYLAPKRVEAMRVRTTKEFQGRSYWVVHPRAADAFKNWPLEKITVLVQAALMRWPELAIVLTGAAADRPALESLAIVDARVYNYAGRLDIADTAALLANAHAVLAPDTGVAHLAGALDVPLISLFAATSSALLGPRARRTPVQLIQKPRTCTPCLEKKCPYTPRNCMDQIEVQEVLQALEAVLQ